MYGHLTNCDCDLCRVLSLRQTMTTANAPSVSVDVEGQDIV